METIHELSDIDIDEEIEDDIDTDILNDASNEGDEDEDEDENMDGVDDDSSEGNDEDDGGQVGGMFTTHPQVFLKVKEPIKKTRHVILHVKELQVEQDSELHFIHII